MKYYYSIYDLAIESCIEFPFLTSSPVAQFSAISLRIDYAAVSPDGLNQPTQRAWGYQVKGSEFWLNVPSVARYLVSNGQHISIDKVHDADEDSIRSFLFSTCFEVLLKQRQLLVMPGYALKKNNQALVFAGMPGNGQAMLQGLFYKRGYNFVSAQTVAINQQAQVLPGIAQLEFWPAIAAALSLELPLLNTVRPAIKKYQVPLNDQYHPTALPLKLIYILDMHQQDRIVFSPIEGSNKINCLHQLLKTNSVSVDLCYEQNLTLPSLQVFDAIPIIGIHLPTTGLKLQQVVQAIEADIVERSLSYA